MHEHLLPKIPHRIRQRYGQLRHKARVDALTSQLIQRGYAEATVRFYLFEWQLCAAAFQDREALPATGARDVADYFEYRLARARSQQAQIRRAIRLFFDGDVGESVRERVPHRPMPRLYESHVPRYIAFVRRHQGRRVFFSIENSLGKFFRWLDCRSVRDLREVTARHVRDFVASHTGKRRSTIIRYASDLRGFLRYSHSAGILAKDLSSAAEVPWRFRPSQPPELLDAQTIERLLAAIDRSRITGKRDYAMLLLAARYGLRPSDIRRLRFEQVHWRSARISLVQSKNQRSLDLPLSADVEAALIDYIRHRPACEAREIFVRQVAPIRPFAYSNSLWSLMRRAIHASKLDLQTKHRGVYLLRHSLATHMLTSGVALHTIKDVLGHASADATRRYAQVDLDGLRSVALPEAEVRR
jgi:site-specific recombinase XerD